jgi:hypothetical protein
MNTKHTQGEWKYLKLTHTNEFEISNGKTRSAVVPYTDDEGLANAKLITAAPELLEALNNLILANTHNKGEFIMKRIDEGIEAIKKATE